MIGQTISHYRILDKIGAGGMGVVYKAQDTKLKRTVALKFLPPELTRDKEAKKRFLHEARAASALDHPNICSIYEIDETEEGRMYMAMGYYEGETLKDRIRPVGAQHTVPMPIDKTINITIQIAEGLQEAHQNQIVHRDIKSANIIITEKGQVKILDFGLAKLKGATKLTKEGTTLGTVAYMSPEQASGDNVDHRSDIWSLGVLLYEMVTGQLPFKGEYEQAIMYAIMNEEPEPVTGLRTGIPPELERIISKVLNKDPLARYQALADLIVDLKNAFKNSKKSSQKPVSITGTDKRKPSKNLIKVMGFILPIALVLTGYLIFKGKTEAPGAVRPKEQTAEKKIQLKWKNSIAVLPFTNISSDLEQEYFCDGMTEEIITKLTYIKDLRVISRTSVMRYRNSQKSLKEIGQELAVENVLEGSVRRYQNRVRITAQLIRVADDAHLWAKNYDQKLEDIFSVQDEVSKSIAYTLKITLSPETIKTLSVGQTESIEAYEYYMKGMHVFHNRYFTNFKDNDFEMARSLLVKAVEIDPDFAQAYNRLIYFHALHFIFNGTESDIKMMKNYADHSVKLNPHSAMGYSGAAMWYTFKFNFNDAHPLYKKALEINPNDPIINYSIVGFYMVQKLYSKAYEFCSKAMTVDPLFFPSYLTAARCQLYLGDFAKCEHYLNQAFEILPNQTMLKRILTEFYLRQNQLERAENHIKKLESAWPDSGSVKRLRALWYALKGDRESALNTGFESDEIFSLLGMKDRAIENLQKSLSEKPLRSAYLYYLNCPFYDNLRNDPRFIQIMADAKKVYKERLSKYGDL